MKFLALKEALSKIGLDGSTIKQAVIAEKREARGLPYQHAKKKEKVVGGEVQWKPVDRQAAMLLAKASWIYHPPSEPRKPIELPEPSPKPRTFRKRKNAKREKAKYQTPVVRVIGGCEEITRKNKMNDLLKRLT